jgi:antitoxin (DNA-binding transcriptional repressor) of toxin-antitoxin stability system
MEVTIAEASARLAELVQAAENGEHVVLTKNGAPVVEIRKHVATPGNGNVRLGTMRGKIKFNPGWDDPIDEDRFLAGDF